MSVTLLDNSDKLDNTKYFKHATFGRRLFATLIDTLLVGALKIGLLMLNLFFLQNVIVQYLKAIIYPFYKIYLEGENGQTLGKRWVGIKVIKIDHRNSNMDIKSSIARYSFYFPYFFIELLVVYYTFDIGVLVNTDVEHILQTYQGFKKDEPTLLFLLKVLTGLIMAMSVLFILEGKNRQALHDRVSKTICIKVKPKV